MEMTKKEQFIESMEEAIDRGAKYIFTEMYINGYPSTEVIVNPIENGQLKLDYICGTYDDNLCMIKGDVKLVEIISFGAIDNMSQLEYEKNNFNVGGIH